MYQLRPFQPLHSRERWRLLQDAMICFSVCLFCFASSGPFLRPGSNSPWINSRGQRQTTEGPALLGIRYGVPEPPPDVAASYFLGANSSWSDHTTIMECEVLIRLCKNRHVHCFLCSCRVLREFGIFGFGIGYPLLLLPARFCLWIKPNASLVNVLDPLVHFPNLATCGVFLWSGRFPCCGGPS